MSQKETRKFKAKIYSFLGIVNLAILICLYFIMPVIQNYPPHSESIEFQKSIEPFSHIEQYALLLIVATSLHIIALNFLLKRIYKFMDKYYSHEHISYEEVDLVRKDAISIPYKFYLVQMLIIILLGGIPTLLIISDGLTILKFFLMLVSIISLIGLMQYIYLQKTLKSVLLLTYEVTKKYEKGTGYRVSFSRSLMIQILPFMAVAIIVISLIGYAKAVEQKAVANANYYQAYLSNINFDKINVDDIKEKLNEIPFKNSTDYYFIIPPEQKNIYVSGTNNKVSDFELKYINKFFQGNSGITYEFYGTEQQAYTIKLIDNTGRNWYIGFEYSTRDNPLMIYYICIMIGVIILYWAILYVWSKSISKNIVDISTSLRKILTHKKKNEDLILPILSNDEVGDLSYYYNKIEELTNVHLKEIEDNQFAMERQAQFAILGEFAGGLAHDLNSPLSAVEIDIGTLRKYINSDKIAADENVKSKLNEMLNNIDTSLSSMGNTIAGVRNQIRATGDTQREEFLLIDVLEGIKIIFRSIFMKNNCQLEVDIPEDLKIYGERNKLDRVIGNLIKNSLDQYGIKNIKGIVKVAAKEDKNSIIISVADTAGGIDEDIEPKIFKEIKTTKKENGTGFGLYYSNTIIEGSFRGRMYFESTQNVGTTFYIELPKNRKEEK